MKVLIFGATGMAGQVITTYLKRKDHEVTTVGRKNCDYNFDITAMRPVQEFFNELDEYDFIINCVGLLVAESNTRPDRASILNSWFPHYIEARLAALPTKLIHLSTDCVFSGYDGPYTEDSVHSEKNSYGRSKSLGEVNNFKDITFRMSIIGPDVDPSGTGLFSFIFKNPAKKIPGWTNAYWNGITTLELAKCIERYMDNPVISGIYHLVNDLPAVSKFDLLDQINKIFKLKKRIIATTGPKTIDKTLLNTRTDFDFKISSIRCQLLELKKFMRYTGAYDANNLQTSDHQSSSDSLPVDEPTVHDQTSEEFQSDSDQCLQPLCTETSQDQ